MVKSNNQFYILLWTKLIGLVFLPLHWHLLLFHTWFQSHFLLSNLNVQLHIKYLVDISSLFIYVVVLYANKFLPYILFVTHLPLSGSSRVLQL